MTTKTKPILNVADVELKPFGAPAPLDASFSCKMGQIGARVGAKKLGYNVTVVPPGKRAFPFHNHRVNEEMFFVLEGEGEVRIGGERHPLRAGDVLACPPGGTECAHQIVNTSSSKELRYLAVSTKESPELCEYPDGGKGKFGFMTSDGTRYVGRFEGSIDYWDGETGQTDKKT